jgi:hypothetical protein
MALGSQDVQDFFIWAIYILSRSAFDGKYIDCRELHGVSNIRYTDDCINWSFNIRKAKNK